jgi:precorrin-2 dehydrogenase/sirohydrochlorin ferrochelatase
MFEEEVKRSYYPLFLDIKGKRCVVLGGGSVALRKVVELLEHSASVSVISPSVCPELIALSDQQKIHIIFRCFEPEDVRDAFILIAATDKNEVNELASREAKKQRVLVNVVDDAAESDFILPAVLSRGDLTFAISTSGKSPAFARRLRDYLAAQYGQEYSELTDLVAEVRSEIKLQGKAIQDKVWQEALNLDLLINLLKNGQREQAKVYLLSNLMGSSSASRDCGAN